MDQQIYIQRVINILEDQRNRAMSDAAVNAARADTLAADLERANARVQELEAKESEAS